MHLLRYLDDWLVVAESRDLLLRCQDLLLQLCSDLRIIINWKKSELIPVVIYQCFPVEVGSSSSKPYGLGSMVRRGITGTHQHPGDEGNKTGPGIVSPPAGRTECRPDERQRVSCRLSPASGQHSIPQIVPDGLIHRPLGGTPLDPYGGMIHTRQKEHPGGSVNSSGPDPPDRMVTAAPCVQWDLLGIRTTSSGPVRH